MSLSKEALEHRNEKAKEHGVYTAKNFHDRLPDIKFFGIPKEPFSGRADFTAESGFKLGFDAGYNFKAQEHKELRDAVEDYCYEAGGNKVEEEKKKRIRAILAKIKGG